MINFSYMQVLAISTTHPSSRESLNQDHPLFPLTFPAPALGSLLRRAASAPGGRVLPGILLDAYDTTLASSSLSVSEEPLLLVPLLDASESTRWSGLTGVCFLRLISGTSESEGRSACATGRETCFADGWCRETCFAEGWCATGRDKSLAGCWDG